MIKSKKKILFVTGTRADFGKMKRLMQVVEGSSDFECHIFVTGMHTLKKYGLTLDEVRKSGFKNINIFYNQIKSEPMELILANTINGFSRFIHENRPDMIVIHGDRVEALACSIVGSIQNILVCHIEGGELSGTVDEILRHAATKMSHLHMVANLNAKNRLMQLGEKSDKIFVIGSPDIDVMVSENLPSLDSVKEHYNIPFSEYSVALFHPVTTELNAFSEYSNIFVKSLLKSERNYIVIFPNNDEGNLMILDAYRQLENNDRIKIFPSIRFESFLVLLKNSGFLIGNSSAGIREAPFYGLPSINIGTRQNNRFLHPSIVSVGYKLEEILDAINYIKGKQFPKSDYFGDGSSDGKFFEILRNKDVWRTSIQKQFKDYHISE